jgi:phosphoribosylformylglycinamidine synthase PurS subunit
MSWEIAIEVMPLEEIADPEGAAILRALPALGFNLVDQVRVGKSIRIRIDVDNENEAVAIGEKLCERILVNPIIEYANIRSLGAVNEVELRNRT